MINILVIQVCFEEISYCMFVQIVGESPDFRNISDNLGSKARRLLKTCVVATYEREEITQCWGFGKNESRRILETFLNTPGPRTVVINVKRGPALRQTKNQRGFKLGNVATYTEVRCA